MGELSRLEAAGGHWRRANLYALSAGPKLGASQGFRVALKLPGVMVETVLK